MKVYFLFFLVLLIMSFSSAESIGNYILNEEMQITNYCQNGECTYITLHSIEYPNGTITYPNTNMTMNEKVFNYSFTPTTVGEYVFVSCGDPQIDICDRDTFYVNLGGEENSSSINIILLLFFVGLFLGFIYIKRNINYEKWYKNILVKYESRNYIKLVFSAVAYNLLKNTFGVLYLLGFPIVIIFSSLVINYNILEIYQLTQTIVWIYSWGFILVGFSLFGVFQEFLVQIVEDIKNLGWGISNGE